MSTVLIILQENDIFVSISRYPSSLYISVTQSIPTTFITKFGARRQDSRTQLLCAEQQDILQFLVCHLQALRRCEICLDAQGIHWLDTEDCVSGLNRVLMTVCYLPKAM